MSESIAGRLLVATPTLGDPNFDHTVALMLEHSPNGALGVTLDRPGEGVPPPLEEWAVMLSPPGVMYRGGPLDTDSVVALGRRHAGDTWEAAASVSDDIVVVDLRQGPDAVLGHLDALRMFRGYAGWGPGQLETELAERAWVVLDCRAGDVFSADPAGLWRRVLSRQAGALARWGRLMPDDLRLN